MNKQHHTNHLIDETSPYLLQHAHNPVDWYPWGPEAFNRAKAENKLVLISIGYAACHWCHVMAHESFEDDEIAQLMNENFICIKIDREERPDVDKIYMHAVQMMTGSGGWPLNCFALPDGRPVYGGTYFRPDQWKQVLVSLQETWKTDPGRVEDYATKLHAGITAPDLVPDQTTGRQFSQDDFHLILRNWRPYMDMVNGGQIGAPKFPMPVNLEFLLALYQQTEDSTVLEYVETTLTKMAIGGIYDQLGGGFSRYSTDASWRIPHFEKMLYDNAQLIRLYSHAFLVTHNPLYQRIVFETLDFIQREMTGDQGNFFASVDADSEGKEGWYYLWTRSEMDKALSGFTPDERDMIAAYYQVGPEGDIEGKNVLVPVDSQDLLLNKYGIDKESFHAKLEAARKKMFAFKSGRIYPDVDTKSLTSWNALMAWGYLTAYRTFGNRDFLLAAERNLDFLTRQQTAQDGALYHSYNKGKSSIPGLLEDYVFLAGALIEAYQATFDEKFIALARKYTSYALGHFADEQTDMFYLSGTWDTLLITRKLELEDMVIPSGNAVMAANLMWLGRFFDESSWVERSRKMTSQMQEKVEKNPAFHAHWAMNMVQNALPATEVVISGPDALEMLKHWNSRYFPFILLAGNTAPSELPLLKDRFVSDRMQIYICENNVCQMPVKSIEQIWSRLK